MDFLFRWRDAVVSTQGPESSTTRHVLLTLALHMDAEGGSCFPSTRTLAGETALSRKAVEHHLKRAETSGWLERSPRSGTGQGWKRMEYQARIPEKVGNDVTHVEPEGGEPRSPRPAEGGEPHVQNVGNHVPLSTSVSTPVVAAVERFLELTDTAWSQNTSIEEWAQKIEAHYPQIDVAREIDQCAGWVVDVGRTLKSPTSQIHNWLKKAKPTQNGNGAAPRGMSAAELREWEEGLDG